VSKPASLRVVFDCNVFLQAAVRESGPAAICLGLAEHRHIQLYTSKAILREVREVLNRPELQTRFITLTNERVDAFMERLQAVTKRLHRVPRAFSYPRDVDDEPYIDLAAAANADYLVSRDKDLLHLMTGHNKECKEFRQKFRHLEIVEPEPFLQIVKTLRRP
jgi:putative PIN family toxin of toxin-antitoxin system